MNAHLTDEQLSAHHDGALDVRARGAVEAHLAACEHCRARLAELAALDASLAEALTHEPADAYFDALADRVAARVAADRATPARVRRVWDGWFAPRVLAWGGALAAVAVVSVLVLRSRAPHDDMPAPMAAMEATAPAVPREDGAPPAPAPAVEPDIASRAPAAAPSALAPEPSASMPRDEVAPPVAATDAAAPAITAAPLAVSAPPSPVVNEPEPPAAMKSAPAPAPAFTAERAPSVSPPTWTARGNVQGFREGRARGFAAPTAPAPTRTVAAPWPRDPRCGVVRDTRGTPLVGAQVTALGRLPRMARTDRTGRFCFEAAVTGDTLVILRVGFEPLRRVVAPGDSLQLELEPVGTIGPRDVLPVDR